MDWKAHMSYKFLLTSSKNCGSISLSLQDISICIMNKYLLDI